MGRKMVLVGSTILSSFIKIAKSYASSYYLFVGLEMIDAGISSAIYPAALILGMELATTEHSILASCIIVSLYPVGQVVTALIASYVHNYKWMLRIIALVGLATFPYIWVLPESLRWLLVKRKYKQAIDMVENAAKINGITLSKKTRDIIANECKRSSNEAGNIESKGSFTDILKNGSLLARLIMCTFCWISSTFITYGVSIMSTSLKGDKVNLKEKHFL